MNKNLKIAGALLASSLLISSNAMAATQSVTANIAFEAALTLTKNTDIDFGIVQAGTADTYTIDTAAAVTAAGAGQILGGTPAAGDIDIAGSAVQLVDITANNFVVNAGVTPANATCAYGAAAEAACTIVGAAAPGAGTNLLVGVDAVVDGTQAAGSTAAPTFDIVVTYN